MSKSQYKRKTKQPYRLITTETIALHKAKVFSEGNGTQAVSVVNPDYEAPHQRSYRIVKKSEDMPSTAYIDEALQQIAGSAVRELDRLVESNDEKISLSASKYAIDQVRGKAIQKSLSLTGKLNIQSVLD